MTTETICFSDGEKNIMDELSKDIVSGGKFFNFDAPYFLRSLPIAAAQLPKRIIPFANTIYQKSLWCLVGRRSKCA